MIYDPFYLAHIVTANAEIATALENLPSDDTRYDEKQIALSHIMSLLESLIIKEVNE